MIAAASDSTFVPLRTDGEVVAVGAPPPDVDDLAGQSRRLAEAGDPPIRLDSRPHSQRDTDALWESAAPTDNVGVLGRMIARVLTGRLHGLAERHAMPTSLGVAVVVLLPAGAQRNRELNEP
jgi:hypothetical protein